MSLPDLDEVLHAKTRLGVMTLLTQWGSADFATLRDQLGLTDGNLGAHVRVLERAGYVSVDKTFVDRKPRTTYRVTREGRRAFRAYLAGLEAVIRMAGSDKPARRTTRSA